MCYNLRKCFSLNIKEKMAGSIKFKFDSYEDSEGVAIKHEEEGKTILVQEDSVSANPLEIKPEVKQEIVQGKKSLNDLIKEAKRAEERIVAVEDTVIEKKIEVDAADETGMVEQVEKKEKSLAEKSLEKAEYKKIVREILSEIRIALENKLRENEEEPGVPLAIFGDVRKEILDKQNFDLNLNRSELEEKIKREFFEGVEAYNDGESQQKLLKICQEVFGFEAEKTVKEIKAESGELTEKQEAIEKVFAEVFDEEKFKGVTIEVAGEKAYSVSRAISTGKFETGAITKMQKAFEAEYVGELALEEIEKALVEFCKAHVDEFAKKELQKQALLMACGENKRNVAEKSEQEEMVEKEFAKIIENIGDALNRNEITIHMIEKNEMYGEESAIRANQLRNRVFEKIKAYAQIFKRYESGERTKELLENFAKCQDEFEKLREIFEDQPSEKIETKSSNKAGERKERREKNYSAEEFRGFIDNAEAWRTRDLEEGVQLGKRMIIQLEELLKGRKVENLQKHKSEFVALVKEANGRLAKIAEMKKKEAIIWKKEFSAAAEKIKEVDAAEFAKLKVQNFESFDVKKAFEDTVAGAKISKEALKKARELAQKINQADKDKRLVVFDGETYFVEGVLDAEPEAHHAEHVDKHPEAGNGIERDENEAKIFELFEKEASDTAKFLLGEYEKESTFPANYPLEMKINYLKPKIELICFELLVSDYEFSLEKAREYAEEIAKGVKL